MGMGSVLKEDFEIEKIIERLKSWDNEKTAQALIELFEAARTSVRGQQWGKAKQYFLKIESLDPQGMYAKIASEYYRKVVDLDDGHSDA